MRKTIYVISPAAMGLLGIGVAAAGLLTVPTGEEDKFAATKKYEDYLGTYYSADGPPLYGQSTVAIQDGGLVVDIPGEPVHTLKPAGREDRWSFSDNLTATVSFDRDHEGDVVGMKLYMAEEEVGLSRARNPIRVVIDRE